MKDNPLFYTASMARLCADQGYFEKSADIYRRLTEESPDSADLKAALAEVESKITAASRSDEDSLKLESLVEKWVGLLIGNDIKHKFEKISSSIRQS